MTKGGEIRTLDYARLVCPLWQACRSMLARIEMLEERVAQLSASQENGMGMYPSQTALIIRCCVQKSGDDDWEDDDEEEGAREEAVQLVEHVPWHGRTGGGPAGAPARPPAAVPRSLSDASTVVPG